MKVFTLALVSFTLSAFAQENFTRYQAENDHFHDYTLEEMSARFGETRALLPFYACDGKSELDPFWMPRKNEKKNSLKVQLYKEDRILTYKKGRYYTESGDEVYEHTNAFTALLVPVMEELERISETKKLLRNLEESPYTLTIAFGGNSFAPRGNHQTGYHGIYRANALAIMDHGRMTSENIDFSEIGSGGHILWNPKDDKLPGAVTLAHEMYHAIDSARGLLDMRFIQGEGYEMAFVSEYRATFFENIVRKAKRIKLRTHYGNTTEGPGLLDPDGKPRFISSPCLK